MADQLKRCFRMLFYGCPPEFTPAEAGPGMTTSVSAFIAAGISAYALLAGGALHRYAAVLENRLRTMAPQRMRPIPMKAAASSFWP
jgi:hypothetical protein